jgi:thiaminase
MALGNGTLPVESFKGYIIQDYLYLVRSLSSSLAGIAKANIQSTGSLLQGECARSIQSKEHRRHLKSTSSTQALETKSK